MSMNLNLMATILATLPNGKKRKFTEHFELFQTPTPTTYSILESKNRLMNYIKWIQQEESEDLEIDDCPTFYKDHIKDLKKWINQHTKEGWKIRWYMN